MSMEEVSMLGEDITKLRKALDTIAGGHTTRFPGAPDVMVETPESFRSKMWAWSQAVAKAALEE